MRPRLKPMVWERTGSELRVVYDPRAQLLLADPDGGVERLLTLLRQGGRSIEELAGALGIRMADLAAGIAQLDQYGLLEDGDRLGSFGSEARERYYSNLAFFESFASLARSSEEMQQQLLRAHVLVLGAGGLNSSVLPHLCGLGVGRLTVLDRDRVESRNFARQYLYRWEHIGSRKVDRAADWVRAFDPHIDVEAVDLEIDSPTCVAEVLDRFRPDVVASGVDHPNEIDRWVNAACVTRGVPWVRGGISATEGLVYSVRPGHGACAECALDRPDGHVPGDEGDADAAHLRAGRLLARTRPSTNRGIGPVAGLLGALAAFEVLRYITGFEPPAYAGRPLVVDFANACTTRRQDWRRDPGCAVCGPNRVHQHSDHTSAPGSLSASRRWRSEASFRRR